jgi:hypothetical protein
MSNDFVCKHCGRHNGNELELVNGAALSFDAFWATYPRRVAKTAAIRAWKHLTPSEREAARVGVSPFIAQVRDAQFIPYPATYLNQKRWEDQDERRSRRHTIQDGFDRIFDAIDRREREADSHPGAKTVNVVPRLLKGS